MARPRVINPVHADTSVSDRSGFYETNFERHVAELEQGIPDGFFIVVQRPFVVVGNESTAQVKMRAEKTIKWAVDLLKKEEGLNRCKADGNIQCFPSLAPFFYTSFEKA